MKKLLISTFIVVGISYLVNKNDSIASENIDLAHIDAQSALYNVSVDTSLWDIRWNNNIESIKTTWNEDLYALTDIHVGEAFYKEKVDGMYWTSMIFAIKTMPKNTFRTIHHKVLWNSWDETVQQYGVLSSLNFNSKINDNDAKVIDSTPKYSANGTSYSISSEVSIGSSFGLGLSGSVSYTENAIEITNNTNSSSKMIDITISRNKNADNGQTKKQMAQENWWLLRYDALTKDKYLKQEMNFTMEYQMLEGKPDTNPSIWRTSRTTFTLSFV